MQLGLNVARLKHYTLYKSAFHGLYEILADNGKLYERRFKVVPDTREEIRKHQKNFLYQLGLPYAMDSNKYREDLLQADTLKKFHEIQMKHIEFIYKKMLVHLWLEYEPKLGDNSETQLKVPTGTFFGPVVSELKGGVWAPKQNEDSFIWVNELGEIHPLQRKKNWLVTKRAWPQTLLNN